MTTNELKVLSIIWDWGGEASVDIITREAAVSINYARTLCKSLEREGCIEFLGAKLCKIRRKGKLQVAGKRGRTPQKIVVPKRTKRGKLILNY